MPLSWNEIRSRAVAFATEWSEECSENAEAKTFWDEFFRVFGVQRRRIAAFEQHVEKAGKKAGYIDLFWPGVLIAEHKSRGKDLERAFTQAMDYFPGIRDVDLPRYVVVSDFARFRIHDLDSGEQIEFALSDLPQHVQVFGFIAGYQARVFKEQDPVNAKAAEKLAKLHDALLDIGYDGHDLEVYLVRILFCLFAEDTGIFMPRSSFSDFVRDRTSEDGADLGARLSELFEVLNTPEERRLKNRDEQLLSFPYVNGNLFSERLRPAAFDATMREALLDCADLDWGQVSPAIFGSLFQSIMNSEARRNLGAHYTSEQNILKVIGPLFLDDLKAELVQAGSNRRKLNALHEKLGRLHYFDPACGCGNFLVITYREIRLLELEILKSLHGGDQQQLTLDVGMNLLRVDVDQFHGIEIEEWPAQIAQVAMWLMDHQMNILVSETFGQAFARIPLRKSAHIVHANALRTDWSSVVPTQQCSYVFGNPPFNGSKTINDAQTADRNYACAAITNHGDLDFVCGWYAKAIEYIQGTEIECALVSTSSITQGEQVGLLFSYLLSRGLHINFAHRTFRWRNEARGVAAVHCVIIGFSLHNRERKRLFEYDDIGGDPHEIAPERINPYLANGPDILLPSRTRPLCDVPTIRIGNKPIDGGFYLFTPDEKDAFIAGEPASAPYFKRWIGSKEFINGEERWCLWLGECSPTRLRSMPKARALVEAVRKFRLGSGPNKKGNYGRKRPPASTQALAARPTRFHVETLPDDRYLVVPKVSSERRTYIPIGYLGPDELASDLVHVVLQATPYHLGVLCSNMHMAWVRAVCGRLESRYRYSGRIVYNNYPWPAPTDNQRAKIEATAQGILDARALYPDASLADLYDPLSMPDDLLRAHRANDRAVDAAYGRRSFAAEADRVGFLFELYEAIVSANMNTVRGEPTTARPTEVHRES